MIDAALPGSPERVSPERHNLPQTFRRVQGWAISEPERPRRRHLVSAGNWYSPQGTITSAENLVFVRAVGQVCHVEGGTSESAVS